MVAVGRSNPTGGNILVNLFFRNFLSCRYSVRLSVRFAYREKPEYKVKESECLCLINILLQQLNVTFWYLYGFHSVIFAENIRNLENKNLLFWQRGPLLDIADSFSCCLSLNFFFFFAKRAFILCCVYKYCIYKD